MGTVKGATNFGIDERLERLRLQVVVTEMGRRIGSRIRQRRTELGLTQKQVAKCIRADFDKQRISDWERGANIPNEANFAALVTALEVPDVSYFYEEAEQPDVLDALASANGHPPDLAAQLVGITNRLDSIDRRLEEVANQQGILTETDRDVLRQVEAALRRLGLDIGRGRPQSRGVRKTPPAVEPPAA